MTNQDATTRTDELAVKGRILIIDEHALFRDIISIYLTSKCYEVSDTGDIKEAVYFLQIGHKFDLILLDCQIHNSISFSNFVALRDVDPDSIIAILTASLSPLILTGAKKIGANGFISKKTAPRSFLNAVDIIVSGTPYFEPPTERNQLNESNLPCLTAREHGVLAALCDGHSNKKISNMLGISEATVKVHLKSIYLKMGARSRSHAYALAQNNNMA